MMNPMNIDLSGARLAVVASNEGDGRERWTELRVYHHPLLTRAWIAEVVRISTVEGERETRRVMASASLERALRLFDDSDIGIIAKETAREFADEECLPTCPPQMAPMDDREALALLFGVEPGDLSVNAAAAAFGIGESSLRMALKEGRDIRVPLAAVLPYIDRAAFQRARNEKAA